MPKPGEVIDAHRLIGPVPMDDLPVDPRPEMDRLGVAAACVTHTLSLHSDAAAGNEALLALNDPRLIPVPVVVPGVPGASTPGGPGEVTAWDVRMIRLCPKRHGFELTGPIALRWLAALNLPVAIDFAETSPGELHTLARELPGLRILLLNPGYRRLRAVAELMAEIPGLWLEMGTVNTQGGVEWLAGLYGADRLVFGTGAPVMDDCGPRFLLDHLALSSDETAAIASGSLRRLLSAPGSDALPLFEGPHPETSSPPEAAARPAAPSFLNPSARPEPAPLLETSTRPETSSPPEAPGSRGVR
ncbi:amidohydrolase family protein [Streptosporangium soli]|nr:amidohydrolase [Streptosporangium sp. KLBMP 9127]